MADLKFLASSHHGDLQVTTLSSAQNLLCQTQAFGSYPQLANFRFPLKTQNTFLLAMRPHHPPQMFADVRVTSGTETLYTG
jgi:hypothetical protein